MKTFRIIGCLLVATIARLAVAQESDVLVGRSAAGRLKFLTDYTQPFELGASIFPDISGYATGLLGIHANDVDDPTNDFFQLSSASDLRIILVAKDAGMEVWNDTGTGFLSVGGSFYIGQPFFDTHPIWNLVTGRFGHTYALTLKLHDVNGVYSDSDPFALSFTPAIPLFQINLTRAGPQHVTLSWTTNATSWTLESAGATTGQNWNTVTNLPAISGTNFSLTVEAAGAQRFFRLRAP